MQTIELTGAALDWAVAKAEGLDYFHPEIGPSQPDYSTDWAQGGPIIQREKIELEYDGFAWWARIKADDDYTGLTPLRAAMRCYVASKLGDEIEIPAELETV